MSIPGGATESHSQPADKSGVAGDPATASPVWIVASKKEFPSGSDKIWFEGSVALFANFTLNPAHIVANELKANTWFNIFSDSAKQTLLQTVQMHTSCSRR